jgi:hypothetical protein
MKQDKCNRINETGNINQIYSSSAEDIKTDIDSKISLTKY